ncbi:hypothetical protein TWF106_007020 [Orbilia oligospora]|uniref:Transmembrane protein n=1 Tax=Orbilia oligospora TaxID=2813651 RepID=A0A6G1MIW0_ORBOL|nr:hypothetical protein TWF679_005441 [Orbilia oligospora]KAF3219600.1 hypothetical protein TWF106_007020 [Orbilia oligospora]KAF3230347.1 hypothetical protein TWF191_010236 [Orbilia oligospora]KAF3260537.1 hypothetical protein TWF192_009815 [Orbilia oligospora]
MEHQQTTKPDDNEDLILHKSKFIRVLLGIGLAFQTTIGCSALFLIFQNSGYNYGGFSFEFFRLLCLIYAISYVWNCTIWFLCIYYNKTLPRDKLFILLELARSIPWLLASLVFFGVAIPEVIRDIQYIIEGGYYVFERIAKLVLCTVVILPALWSLVYMFLYFIRERKEEIVKVLKIGKKKGEEEDKKAGGDAEETTARDAGNDQDAEETALLIDHDEMV